MKRSLREHIYYDPWILYPALMILGMGLLMVASASMAVSARQFGSSIHFLAHQSLYAALGLGLSVIVTRIPIRTWQRFAPILLFLGLALLVVLFVPGLGRRINGSVRWLKLGLMGLQVSEVMKLCMIIFMADYIDRRGEELRSSLIGFIKPMGLLAVTGILLLLEPDFGATTVITAVTMGMLFLGGVRLRQFMSLVLLVAMLLAGLILVVPYRLKRLTGFLHPWATQFGSGYQLTQSLIAFGRGGIWGVGLGNGIQKQFYLPEAHTDFLFAVFAEELGLVGAILLIGLFCILIGRMFVIARRAQIQCHSIFSAFLAYGCAMWFAFQGMINIGVSAGVLPTKGLTLPLVSYGGSSLLVGLGGVVGLMLRISHEQGH